MSARTAVTAKSRKPRKPMGLEGRVMR